MTVAERKLAIVTHVYDTLFAAADAILKAHNPCEHTMCDKKHTCLGKLFDRGGGMLHG